MAIEAVSNALTARDIQRRLISDRYQRNFVMPNYTPINWFECDVLELTAAGFFREYEIKLTRSDFKADAEKVKYKWEITAGRFDRSIGVTKHNRLGNADLHGPSRFYFVVPRGLIAENEIPAWAGLIVCWRVERHSRLACFTVKEAPVIHRHKANPDIRTNAAATCYWRMHHLFQRK